MLSSLTKKAKKRIRQYLTRRLAPKGRSDAKVFCIGLNKTGTTSLEAAFKSHGFRVGNQSAGEDLIGDWGERDFDRIIKLCYTADAFQDAPFSLPFTYQALDMHFPNAKFILTIRDDFEQWYDSITRFHSKNWADGVRMPTVEDLKKATYRYKGDAYVVNRLMFTSPESEPYEKESLRRYYESHNHAVVEYFRHRSDRLLVINLAESSAYSEFCSFLKLDPIGSDFPWLNKTDSK